MFWTFLTFLLFLMVTKSPVHQGFQSTHNVPRIPKRYHMWPSKDKIPLKTPKILQNPIFWTLLTFLIFLMVTICCVHHSRVLTLSQGFQKGIICGGKMIKISYCDGHLMADENFFGEGEEGEGKLFFIGLI